MDENYFYLTFDEECHVIDLKNGKTIKKLKLPSTGDWGYIASYKDYLIGTSQDPKATNKGGGHKSDKYFWNGEEETFVTSDTLTIINKSDDRVLRTYSNAGHSIVNNTITIADDKMFFVETKLETGSHNLPAISENSPKIVALNLLDKSELWEKKPLTIRMQSVLYLAYLNEHLYASACTMEGDGKKKTACYHYQKMDASNGEMVWSKENLVTGQGSSHNENVINSVYLDDYIWCVPPSGGSFKISTADGTSI
jgi:hypothetical protein